MTQIHKTVCCQYYNIFPHKLSLGSFLNFCTALCNSEKILIFVYKL